MYRTCYSILSFVLLSCFAADSRSATTHAGDFPLTPGGSDDGWNHLSFVDEQRPFNLSGKAYLKEFSFAFDDAVTQQVAANNL